MLSTSLISIIIIITNVLVSYRGFINNTFFDAYKFEVDKILTRKEYVRLLSSGFLHVSWTHLVVNMLTLYLFSEFLTYNVGPLQYLLIYFVSLVAGDLLSLYIHRFHGDYSSVGASGAISGIVFASVALFPGMDVRFFFIPIPIAGWLYGLLYMLYTIYGIRSKRDNIGHEAHLGGAVGGIIIALILYPAAVFENYITILLITVPAIAFILLVIKKPEVLLVDNPFFSNPTDNYSIDHQYNQQKARQQKEIDAILDKINVSGINSLSKREREKLEAYSKKAGR